MKSRGRSPFGWWNLEADLFFVLQNLELEPHLVDELKSGPLFSWWNLEAEHSSIDKI